MTLAEHTAYLRQGAKLCQINFKDSILQDGVTDAMLKIHMGETGKNDFTLSTVDLLPTYFYKTKITAQSGKSYKS